MIILRGWGIMNNFKIIVEDGFPYSAFILFQTHVPPFSLVKELEGELQCKKINGKILFDTLFHSGNTNDRFLEIYFDGNEINPLTAKVVNIEKGNEIRKIVANVLKGNSELLDNSILNSVQKRLLTKGISL